MISKKKTLFIFTILNFLPSLSGVTITVRMAEHENFRQRIQRNLWALYHLCRVADSEKSKQLSQTKSGDVVYKVEPGVIIQFFIPQTPYDFLSTYRQLPQVLRVDQSMDGGMVVLGNHSYRIIKAQAQKSNSGK